MKNAIFEGITPNVPRFFRIGFRFERISGRSAAFLQTWHFAFFRFDRFDIRFDSIENASERRGGPPWFCCFLFWALSFAFSVFDARLDYMTGSPPSPPIFCIFSPKYIKFMKIFENLRKSQKIFENLWKFLKSLENLGKPLRRCLGSEIFRDFQRFSEIFRDFQRFSEISHAIPEKVWKSLKKSEKAWKSLKKSENLLWIVSCWKFPS